jgi:hypothetical protein
MEDEKWQTARVPSMERAASKWRNYVIHSVATWKEFFTKLKDEWFILDSRLGGSCDQ